MYIKYGDERKKLIKTDGSALTLSGKINVYTLEDINIYIDAKIEPFTLNYKGNVDGVFKNFQGVLRSIYFNGLVGHYGASFILNRHGTYIILELDKVQSTHDFSNGEDVYNLCSVYDDTLTKDGVQLSSDDIQYIGKEHVRRLVLDNVPFYMYVTEPNSTSNVYIYAGDYNDYLKYRLVKEDGSLPDSGELSGSDELPGRITIIDIDRNNMTATYSNDDITTGLIFVRSAQGLGTKSVCNIIEGSTIGDFYITNSIATSERTYLFNGRIIWNGRQWLIYPKDRAFTLDKSGLRAIGGILQVERLGNIEIRMNSGIGYYYKKRYYNGDQIWPDTDGIWRWTRIGEYYRPLSVIVAGRGDIPARGNVKLDFIDGETYTYRRYPQSMMGNYYYWALDMEATRTDTSLYGNISLNDLVLENNVLGQNAEDAFDALTDRVKVLKGHLHMSLVPEQEESVADNHFIVSNEFLANEQLLLVFVNGIQMPFTTDENIIILNQSIRGQHVMTSHKSGDRLWVFIERENASLNQLPGE